MTTPESSNRIAILAPMRSELRPLVHSLSLKRSRSSDRSLLWGTSGRIEIVATTTGIGTQAATHTAERVLDTTPIHHLVVAGIAGGIGPSVDIGDLVIPNLVIDLATGLEYRPTVIGGDEKRGTLATSDDLLVDQAEIAHLEAQGVIAVDMETAAIAAVCERRKCPWSVFRAISDHVDDGFVDTAVFGLTTPDGGTNLPALVRFVLTNPKRIRELALLGRGLRLATHTAASAVVRAIGNLNVI